MDKKLKLKVLIVLLIAGMIFSSGCIQQPESNINNLTIGAPKAQRAEGLKPTFASYYEIKQENISLKAPSYSLPLELTKTENYEKIQSAFNLKDSQANLLRKNGFVVVDWRGDDIVEPYKQMKMMDVPIFVTTDSLLHLYRIQFNELLKNIEQKEFYNDLDVISKTMEAAFTDEYNRNEGDLKEAAKRNVEYFAVGLKLLDPNATVPEFARADVDAELRLIEGHEGFSESPIFKYKEDYSQYVPRGHYTGSEELKRYFKSMMWYGRMAFLLKEGYVSKEDARIQTIQASWISSKMDSIKTSGNKTVAEDWNRIYTVTAFFVGVADDLTPYEYRESMLKVFGSTFKSTELNDNDKLLNLKAELAVMRSPEIYGGTGRCEIDPPITEEKVNECFEKSKGMRFMGQKFVPDSYMFQNLVLLEYTGNSSPFTMVMSKSGPIRGFPRGLDTMALLDSQRARDILEKEGDTDYKNYDEKFKGLKAEFDMFNESEWTQNLYWSWLYTIKPLLKEYGPGYPTFMQTQAWQDKELNTALASWTELRHDTILYAKQSYTIGTTSLPAQPMPVVGYVEPVPEFYARLLAMTKMTKNGLGGLEALDAGDKTRLESLESILSRLLELSTKELENQELTEEDYTFIRNFGENLDSVVAGVDTDGKQTTLIADVHTDTNTGKVLEEGTGEVNVVLVAYKVPDGRIIIGAGPVIPYYEFKQPMQERLTDETWREMLKKNPPDAPAWTESFMGMGE
ncbi:MAG: DUF3160 domain-containing protein [Candidatus Methanoperedens sp.]|nr:DUF3160 domain-containing protein [Candidatus Methanoperedens sp.]